MRYDYSKRYRPLAVNRDRTGKTTMNSVCHVYLLYQLPQINNSGQDGLGEWVAAYGEELASWDARALVTNCTLK